MNSVLQFIYRTYIVIGAGLHMVWGAIVIALASWLLLFALSVMRASYLLSGVAFLVGGLALSKGANHFFGHIPKLISPRPIPVPRGAGSSIFATRKHMKKGGIT